MDDRRRTVFRRKPIVIALEGDLELWAYPLPWQLRNDLGDLVLQGYISAMNGALQAVQDEPDAAPQLSGALADKFRQPDAVFKAAFPEFKDGEVVESSCQLTDAQIKKLTYEEMIGCVIYSLEVNQLETLRALIDPNFRVPVQSSGNAGTEEVPESGPRAISLVPSSEPALPGEMS